MEYIWHRQVLCRVAIHVEHGTTPAQVNSLLLLTNVKQWCTGSTRIYLTKFHVRNAACTVIGLQNKTSSSIFVQDENYFIKVGSNHILKSYYEKYNLEISPPGHFPQVLQIPSIALNFKNHKFEEKRAIDVSGQCTLFVLYSIFCLFVRPTIYSSHLSYFIHSLT